MFGQDHWGHGLSGGYKGDIEEFAYLVNDFKQLVLDQRKAFAAQLPFFVLGAPPVCLPACLHPSIHACIHA